MDIIEIENRQLWLEMSNEDISLLRTNIYPILVELVDKHMDNLYEHFITFTETKNFFPNNNILQRAKHAQKHYFLNLVSRPITPDTVAELLKLGQTHQKINLEPKWYIGAYGKILSDLMPDLLTFLAKHPKNKVKSIQALIKIIFFDISIVMENYIMAKEKFIQENKIIINQLQTEQHALKNLLESAPVSIVSLDKNLNCLEYNDKFAQILNITNNKSIIGENIFTLLPELNIVVENFINFKPVSKEALPVKLKDCGQLKYFNVLIWPIHSIDEANHYLIVMLVDITDSINLQQQREDFVATLTHDLKTPILAANRILDLLIEGDFGDLTIDQTDVLRKLLESNMSLYKLVLNLLDIYRYESKLNRLNLTKVNLNKIINQVVNEINPLIEAKQIQLTLNLMDNIIDLNLDQNAIKRVLQNLLDNATKFTSKGGKISLELYQQDSEIILKVNDTGCGIDQELIPKLFDRFWKATAKHRNYSGAGLGLYLCRQIIEEHEGRIWCDSIENVGSNFYIALKL